MDKPEPYHLAGYPLMHRPSWLLRYLLREPGNGSNIQQEPYEIVALQYVVDSIRDYFRTRKVYSALFMLLRKVRERDFLSDD